MEEGGAEAEDDAAADVVDDTEGDDVARLGPPPAPAWTSHSWGEARALMTAFLARQPPACENCGCRNPALSAEAPVKIHRKPLAPKARAINAGVNANVERERQRSVRPPSCAAAQRRRRHQRPTSHPRVH